MSQKSFRFALFSCIVIACVLIVAFYRKRGVEAKAESFVAVDDSRKPFALELPEMGGTQITAPEAIIPTTNVRVLRLRVRQPFADQINYGKIFTSINGESAGTIQSINRASDGYIVTCNLAGKDRFRLHPGKNVVEITAITRDNRTYYASYVLITDPRAKNVKTNQSEDAANGATIEYENVAASDKTQPPTIYLTEPRGAIRHLGGRLNLKVSGVATGSLSAPVSVSINGQAATLSAVESTRGLSVVSTTNETAKFDATKAVAFERAIVVDEKTPAVIVEARDRAGNATRVTLPVRRRTAAVSGQFRGRKFALVVGISRYKYLDRGLNNLAYADADARSIRDFLLRREGGGFSASDILFLENETATLDAMRDALAHFLPRAAPDDLIFVFLAGHGAPDPYAPQNLYFLMHDTKVADMSHTALPMSELRDMLDTRLRAERAVVFVDTCHSGGLSGEKLATTRGFEENNLINLYAARLSNERGRAVLTASDVNELSREGERWGGGHGIFTWAVLEGLRGAADTNGDKIITAGELFDFVRDRVRVETAFRQNPRALSGINIDLPLAVATK